ncbi:hypothetical protein [Streptomyces sp. DH24]|uniref:hypothetical protein n=1 Tax=Streptomyces sp. DH24 TaxID=3040123 RepID=UPI002441E394|nr:hypothetical protein [Streptomyces sp. DH24]MDG9720103.1 hypothetical protein [Streptomyces sp. DH24]
MPLSPPSRMPSGPRRRSLLASAAGAVLLAGCSDSPGTDGRRASAAERVRVRAARDSRRLAEHYDAVIAAHPGLAERLTPLRGEVVRHARAFEAGEGPGRDASGDSSGDSVGEAAGSGRAGGDSGVRTGGKAGSEASGRPPGSPSVSPSASGAPGVVVPGDEKDALAGLAAAERVLAERRSGALLDAPGELARLLASVAAAGAAHVYLLTEGDG